MQCLQAAARQHNLESGKANASVFQAPCDADPEQSPQAVMLEATCVERGKVWVVLAPERPLKGRANPMGNHDSRRRTCSLDLRIGD